MIKRCEYISCCKLRGPSHDHERRANGERLRERTSFQGCTGVLTVAVRLMVALRREVKNFRLFWCTDWKRAVLPSLIIIRGEAPDSARIPIWVPAVVVLSHLTKIVLMRFLCCPGLTSSSTDCVVHISRIAGTQWIALLTLWIALRAV